MTVHDSTPPVKPNPPPQPAARGVPLCVMGVSGCGKSTLARALAQRLGGRCIEGDDFHAAASIAKMSRGIALVDADRWGWLAALARELAHAGAESGPPVLSCSALKRVYRDRLRAGAPHLHFLWLDTPRALLEQRLRTRAAHFMAGSLLDSQLATLEPLQPDEAGLRLDASQPVEALVDACARWAGLAGG